MMPYKKENLSNFEELTRLLNEKKYPHQSLHLLISICKPTVNSVCDCDQKSKICIS